MLSVELITAREAFIEKHARRFRQSVADQISSEASQRIWEEEFLQRLVADDGTLDAAFIVQFARLGHPPADRALRRFIQVAMETDRFQRLPVSVREYAREAVAGTTVPSGYPARAPQAVNNYARDIAIVWLIDRIKARCPKMPKLNSTKHQKSIAAVVGPVFGLSERQARRIHQVGIGAGFDLRFAEFMAGPAGTRPNETASDWAVT